MQLADGGVTITTPDELDRYIRHGGEATSSGARVTADSALTVAAVYACVRIITGAVATLPLDIKRRIDDATREDASDHPLWRVIRRKPNAWQKPAAFRRHMQACLLLRGNAYAQIVRTGRRVVALMPLHPDRMKVEQQTDSTLLYRYRRPDGGEVVYPQGEVLHLVGMSLDGITGVSVLTYARETIGLALATRRHGSDFFKNGTQVGSWIRHPGKVGLEGQEFLRASLDQYRTGGERAGGTLILEEGAEFANMAMTMEDAAFVDTLKLSRTEVAMFFGVPPHMIGDTEKSTSWGTGIEQQSRGFVAYTLEDWLTAWEEAVTLDLAGESDPDIYARFNRAALVRGDIATRWGAYVHGLQWGVWSPNEVRALEDENPRPGGDVYYDPPNAAGGSGTDPNSATDEPPKETA